MTQPYIYGKDLETVHAAVKEARSHASKGRMGKAKRAIDQALAITTPAIERADHLSPQSPDVSQPAQVTAA